MCASGQQKEILLRISEDQHEDLVWLSLKLGLSITDTLRGLIPRYHRPAGRIVHEKDVEKAEPEDAVRLWKHFEKAKLRSLLARLRGTEAAVTLCSELELELVEQERLHLSYPVYRRLSRWVAPRRWTAREKKVKPIAEDISRLLFGEVIQRVP